MLELKSYTENTKLISRHIQEAVKAESKPECMNVRDVRDCAVMALQHELMCKLSGKTSDQVHSPSQHPASNSAGQR